jgi:hypothetical protein
MVANIGGSLTDRFSLHNFAKDNMLPIKVRRRSNRDEELRTVGVGTSVRLNIESNGYIKPNYPRENFSNKIHTIERRKGFV